MYKVFGGCRKGLSSTSFDAVKFEKENLSRNEQIYSYCKPVLRARLRDSTKFLLAY